MLVVPWILSFFWDGPEVPFGQCSLTDFDSMTVVKNKIHGGSSVYKWLQLFVVRRVLPSVPDEVGPYRRGGPLSSGPRLTRNVVESPVPLPGRRRAYAAYFLLVWGTSLTTRSSRSR